MVAVYPSAIKTFAYREDYTELVEAADVNVSYDEIRAIQSTIGVNPQNDTIDGVVNKWPTVGSRISAVRSGVSKPFANVSAHNFHVDYALDDFSISWTNKTWDTHGMWNGGTSLVCPRSGVYRFEVYVRWAADNLPHDNQQPVFNRNGELKIGVSQNGVHYLTAAAGFYPIGWQKIAHQSASITLPWTKGTAMTALIRQDCYTPTLSASAFFSATYERDAPTVNNL